MSWPTSFSLRLMYLAALLWTPVSILNCSVRWCSTSLAKGGRGALLGESFVPCLGCLYPAPAIMSVERFSSGLQHKGENCRLHHYLSSIIVSLFRACFNDRVCAPSMYPTCTLLCYTVLLLDFCSSWPVFTCVTGCTMC